ncbi:MAG: hypothetical protein JWO98_2356 [Frankiales bacterium]|nr:hypothetical protein [Frankiales bacterium]
MQIIARLVPAGILVLTAACSPVEDTHPAGSAETTRAGEVVWSRVFPVGEGHHTVDGKDVHPAVTGLASGPGGDLWITGTFAGSLDLGAGPIHGDGLKVAFVARIDPAGPTRWSTRVDDRTSTLVRGLAVDRAGNAFVSLVPRAGDLGPYLEKIDPGGSVLWRRPLPFQAEDGRPDVLVQIVTSDGAGGVVIVGWIDGAFRVGGTRISGAGSTFAAGLGPEGEARWAQRFGQSSDESAAAAVTDSAGSVIVMEDNSLGKRAPLTKLDRNGGIVWRKPFRRWPAPVPGEPDVGPSAVAVDADDNVLFAGGGPADLGGDPVMNPLQGPWIVKLTPSGELIWRKDRPASLLGADAAGDVRVVSRTAHGFSAARLDVYGAPVWTGDLPNGGLPAAMVVDGAGRMILAGTFHGTLDLGAGALASGDRDGIFLAAIAP